MNKRELLSVRSLRATKNIMQLAAADMLKECKVGYYSGKAYDKAIYMRCVIQNEILKVSIFFAECLRTGGSLPSYELYISKNTQEFLTYDRIDNQWRNAKLDRLWWPAYFLYWKDVVWISPADSKTIKRYLGTEHGNFKELLTYQRQIREKQLKQRYERITSCWDTDLTQIPKLPKDWERWASKVGIPGHYIYYEYSRKKSKTGYCTYCEKEVPIKNPRHNKEGRCPCCRKKVIFKSAGRAGTVITKSEIFYLLQRCKDGLVIRMFQGYRKYRAGEYRTPECHTQEIRRTICDKWGKPVRAYYWGDFKHREMRWIQNGLCDSHWNDYWRSYKGKMYGRTLPNLFAHELSRTGFKQMLPYLGDTNPERYLVTLQERPAVEKLIKAGLDTLALEHLYSKTSDKFIVSPDSTGLCQMLGINTSQLKRLRDADGGLAELEWLRYECSNGKFIPDDVVTWFISEKINPEKLKFICDRMNPVQCCNYIRRQMCDNAISSREVLTTWQDYLSMAAKLNMDVNDAIIYRVRQLVYRHDQLVKRLHEMDLAAQIKNYKAKFTHVDEICQSIKKIYEYADEDYTIIAPNCIEDIVWEARFLDHCVDDERYFERIERQETYILFLRRSKLVGQAYYTLEVEPDGTIRQARTHFNRQKEDFELTRIFLAKWQRAMTKNLTEQEMTLAKRSRVLREQEFKMLREKHSVIHTGDLKGALLVDVLIGDLMENKAVAA